MKRICKTCQELVYSTECPFCLGKTSDLFEAENDNNNFDDELSGLVFGDENISAGNGFSVVGLADLFSDED